MGRLAPLRVLSITIPLCFALGCPSSKKSPTPPTPPNLSPDAVTVLTAAPDVQASHRLALELQIASVTAVEAVGVAYRVFPRAEYDAHAETIVSHVLGTSAHDVPAGGATFAVELQVPPYVPAGDYYLVPHVDPIDVIAESDETDQHDVLVPIVILNERLDQPRLMVERAELDAPAVEHSWAALGTPGPIGLTLLLRAEASAPVLDAEVTACVGAPGRDCALLPLGIWDGGAGAHLPTLVVPRLDPGAPVSVHLDLALAPSLSVELDGLLREAADACLADVPTCVADLGVHQACAEECLAAGPSDPALVDYETLQPCMLKCLPFAVEATLDKPGAVLYEPPGAPFGRTSSSPLQLVAPPPVTPVPPEPLTIRAIEDTVFRAVVMGGVWTCDHPSVTFVAARGSCAAPVVWSVGAYPGQTYTPERGMGTIVADGDTAVYTPAPIFGHDCYPEGYDIRVLVEASACGETASEAVTLISGGADLDPIVPDRVAVLAGAEGTVEFRAAPGCAVSAADITWSLANDVADDGRLAGGRGSIVYGADPLVVAYRPPPSLTPGPPVAITLEASVPTCGSFLGTATISVGLTDRLGFERAFAKSFATDQFGGGVDLYAGAFLDGTGARASAHAIVPVKIFDWQFDVLRATDDVVADPRPGQSSHLIHQIDVFGATVSSLSCPCVPSGPGDTRCDACAPSGTLWSTSKCIPEGPPPLCGGTDYATPCAKSSECTGGLECKDGRCTKECDGPDDCTGNAVFCVGSLQPGPYKKVFFVGVVPVTVEGKLCAELGFDVGLELLPDGAPAFSARLGPFFEVNGYASAAVGYTGMLAAGVRGDLVLLRDEFYGRTTATVVLAPAGGPCAYPDGCVEGTLQEAIENDLQGGSGELYLFADFPTLQWCDWSPCIGVSRERLTIASWGSLYHVANTCDFCNVDADCAAGACVEGLCADGFPGLLCLSQSVYVPAEPAAPAQVAIGR